MSCPSFFQTAPPASQPWKLSQVVTDLLRDFYLWVADSSTLYFFFFFFFFLLDPPPFPSLPPFLFRFLPSSQPIATVMELENRAYGHDSQWNGVEETIEDPEEIRVIFCALDSFRLVLPGRRILQLTIFYAYGSACERGGA